ncbi:MAG: DEAD/DEAH box helicase [Candidatus Omnitrophica bacterium]|nr:DEAD/DEAH box helicase [Candidatus Omnitrophota bacterium]
MLNMLEKFKELGLSENTLDALNRKGFEEPTVIQALTIPLLLKGEVDVIAQAQTGTGKTAAFGLPLIERLQERSPSTQALILVPTRELALQVAEEINSLKGRKKLTVVAIYGGQSMDEQLRRLKRGIDIVVGTPGRVKDHLGRGSLNLSNLSHVVLDEADEMLNMGFIEDIEDILSYTSKDKKMLLFSATIPDRILKLVKKFMPEYELVRAKKEELTVKLTDQIYFEVSHSDKLEALCRIIDSEEVFFGLVFCRTKVDVDNVAKKLSDRGYDCDGLHGDISQHQRERILDKFRAKRINVLIATDVAARGIDINDLTHVINFSLPQNPESYIHRIGRTGRAGKEGTGITFVTHDEYRKLLVIKRMTKTDIRKKKIPDIEEVLRVKRTKIKKDIADISSSLAAKEYLEFAEDFLKDNDPANIVAAFIKYSFGEDLNPNNYNRIRQETIELKGTTRLFVAKGKDDQITPRKLIDMIKQIAKVDSRKIGDIRILDHFSFITVPFEEAEIILRAFQTDKKSHKKPLIERAKDKVKRR